MGVRRDQSPALRERLTYLLKYALVELEELHEQALADQGVTVRELAVLLQLADREPESQQQAAEHLGVDRTTMVALLDGLESKALVARRPDASDRRRNLVEVTEAGRARLAEAVAASDAAERRLLSVLGEADAALLRELLRRVEAGDGGAGGP